MTVKPISVQLGFLIKGFLADMPNILFIKYSEEAFKLSTTKFVGKKQESLTLITLTELQLNENPEEKFSNVDLYPDKLSNMQGREVVLALFNYMPYVLWKETVSKTNCSMNLMKSH